jgi:hypothetical protein
MEKRTKIQLFSHSRKHFFPPFTQSPSPKHPSKSVPLLPHPRRKSARVRKNSLFQWADQVLRRTTEGQTPEGQYEK